ERVPDETVEERDLEGRLRGGDAAVVADHLPEPEELEVIDDEGRDERDRPPCPVRSPDHLARDVALDRPDHLVEGLPEPEEEPEYDAGRHHEGASLDRLGNDARPPALEPAPRHDAVLDAEK